MSELKLQKSTTGYSVATVDNLSGFTGKAFVKELMGTSSMEVSFGTLEAGQAVPFFHRHQQNEEVYIILGGEGTFTLDGEQVEVRSGSIVRIAPGVSRCTAASATQPITYLCIQGKEGSLEQYTATDAIIEQ